MFSIFFFSAEIVLPHEDGDNLLPESEYANVAHPFLFGYGDDNKRKMTMRDYAPFNPHSDVDDDEVSHTFMFGYGPETRKRLRQREERKMPVTAWGSDDDEGDDRDLPDEQRPSTAEMTMLCGVQWAR